VGFVVAIVAGRSTADFSAAARNSAIQLQYVAFSSLHFCGLYTHRLAQACSWHASGWQWRSAAERSSRRPCRRSCCRCTSSFSTPSAAAPRPIADSRSGIA
jgi:hypothetical protein